MEVRRLGIGVAVFLATLTGLSPWSPVRAGFSDTPRGLPDGVSRTLVRVSGSCQRTDVGHRFAQPLTVRVVDGDGRPVAGTVVRFSAQEGAGGSGPAVDFSGRSSVDVPSDRTGQARVVVTGGWHAATTDVTAWIAGSSYGGATFTVTVLAPEVVAAVTGARSAVDPGMAFPTLQARVAGQGGRPLAGVTVRFEVDRLPPPAVGAFVRLDAADYVDVLTDADGLATATAVSSGRPGTVGVRARVVDHDEVTGAQFDLTTGTSSPVLAADLDPATPLG